MWKEWEVQDETWWKKTVVFSRAAHYLTTENFSNWACFAKTAATLRYRHQVIQSLALHVITTLWLSYYWYYQVHDYKLKTVTQSQVKGKLTKQLTNQLHEPKSLPITSPGLNPAQYIQSCW